MKGSGGHIKATVGSGQDIFTHERIKTLREHQRMQQEICCHRPILLTVIHFCSICFSFRSDYFRILHLHSTQREVAQSASLLA